MHKLETRNDWPIPAVQKSEPYPYPCTYGNNPSRANVFEEKDEAAVWGETEGYSTQISGCHEATETRTIRIKKTFFSDTPPQRHRG